MNVQSTDVDLSEVSIGVRHVPANGIEQTLFAEGKLGFVVARESARLLVAEAALKRTLESIDRFKKLV